QQVFQQDLQAEREPLVPRHLVDLENLIACVADAERAARTKGVEASHCGTPYVFPDFPKPYVRLVKSATPMGSSCSCCTTYRLPAPPGPRTRFAISTWEFSA